jgi:hypothetical protein
MSSRRGPRLPCSVEYEGEVGIMSVYMREQIVKCRQDDLMRTAAARRQAKVGRIRQRRPFALPMRRVTQTSTRRLGGVFRALSTA